MIAHAWKGYVAYAFGENELKPISRRGHSAVVFGQTRVGATIVDSLGTLYIAGLMEEYKKGRDWVEQSLNFDQVLVTCFSPYPLTVCSSFIIMLSSFMYTLILKWFEYMNYM